ncbi:tRNA (adenosine(37)-N6)-dimethylallyltransferase MiaA [Pendulispora rubella]|uniref:tRNA dimethylallyltransferase n=1 Tax=Pendulispora rubella TaxID=2741070 RepID=A0ABZ2KY21_9BACT
MDAEPNLTRWLDLALATLQADPESLPVIVGPTASGKTSLAIRLAEALDGEIVSADSVQIYREFDIGSGKPTAEERAQARHHLIDVQDPLEAIDAARFVEMADRAIGDIRARGKRPIVCGGTFLWVRALLHGLAPSPAANEAIRERHRTLVLEQGRTALHDRLKEVDPPSAARLHPNDVVRVSRALEVFELTGQCLSGHQESHGFLPQRYRAHLFAILYPPDVLTDRITARVEAWLAGGWIDEVAALRARGYGDTRAMGSVGYRQVAMHLTGQLPQEELKIAIVRATRVFARRQRTWLNHAPVIRLGT